MSPILFALSLLSACGDETPQDTSSTDDTAADDTGGGGDDTGEVSFDAPVISVDAAVVAMTTSASLEFAVSVAHEAPDDLVLSVGGGQGLSTEIQAGVDGAFVVEITSGTDVADVPLTLVVQDAQGQSDSVEILVRVVADRGEKHPRYTLQGAYFLQDTLIAEDGTVYACGHYASYYGVAFQVNASAGGYSYVKDPAYGPVIGRGCDLGPADTLAFVGQGKFIGNPQDTFVVLIEADGTVAVDTRFNFHSNTKSEYTVASLPFWAADGGLLIPSVTSYDGGGYASYLSRYASDGTWTHKKMGSTFGGRFSAKEVVQTASGQLFVGGTARGTLEIDGGGDVGNPGDADYNDVFIAVRAADLSHEEMWFFGSPDSKENLVGLDDAGEGVVFAGTTDGTLGAANLGGDSDAYATMLDADGAVLWTTQMGTGDTDTATAVLHAYGVVYVAGRIESRGVVWALDAQDGSLLWESIIGAEDNASNIAGIQLDGLDLLISGNTNRDLNTNQDVTDGTGSPGFFAWMSLADGSLYAQAE